MGIKKTIETIKTDSITKKLPLYKKIFLCLGLPVFYYKDFNGDKVYVRICRECGTPFITSEKKDKHCCLCPA